MSERPHRHHSTTAFILRQLSTSLSEFQFASSSNPAIDDCPLELREEARQVPPLPVMKALPPSDVYAFSKAQGENDFIKALSLTQRLLAKDRLAVSEMVSLFQTDFSSQQQIQF